MQSMRDEDYTVPKACDAFGMFNYGYYYAAEVAPGALGQGIAGAMREVNADHHTRCLLGEQVRAS
jgi:hypothetical protein